ncbi:bifunctional: (p)ppGpp synthetase II, guanosine-3',5'-bis pyrophosphate 3'-pyrophosphohydrolase [Catenovulum agarivorans DS-2]|uniref:guanosine-3',5'-bis(diphosphate) 3'-diphosphatase n=1 Tax=Catenovulum agarivorans DS-2 TaxID=1328313 RepID=W7QU01_9ALTE|nr:RelA/SpoT family protein [Catenovulum agarivorans]EWH08920.1 bifunctional: (p)ppGpp synthetase II, guanosine-3',5'-bis pyrophosphate 3'-pyrophosphohydrolase [Catenovulum agarivorans DS-2]
MDLYQDLGELVRSYVSPEEAELVEKAFVVARDAHEGQFRSSGEPYITHPVAVTRILAHMHLDYETLCAALLHDVIEDTDTTKDDLAETFGSVIADLVEGVSKLDKIHFNTKQEAQAENFRKMIMAMVQDIRVILIKLADRTHNMRTLDSLRPDKRRRIATETLEIYAPIAHRLGIHDTKNELENLGFKAMYPMRYRALGAAVKSARGHRKDVIEKIGNEIRKRIGESNIECIVKGREKHLYSIYKKMKNKELMFNDVMDIYAFRIIVKDLDTCYRTFGIVHNLYKPIEGRFKDYIAIPRINGYQSLHTSLIGPHGIPLEIQIRTHDMELAADKGIAAHWMYKTTDDDDEDGKAQSNISQFQKEAQLVAGSKEKETWSFKAGDGSTTAQVRAQRWMNSLVELQQSAGNSFEFIENVKSDLFPEEIYLFTPKGRIIELPKGATPVDFAFALHTDIGFTCVGATVNNKPMPLNQPLESGQTVYIVTSKGARPNANWLNFVITPRARLRIRNYLKNLKGEESVDLGKRLLKVALGDVDLNDIPEENIATVLNETKLQTVHQLLAEIGLGNLMSIVVARKLLKRDDAATAQGGESYLDKKVSIRGAEGMLVTFAKCCRPIPGDSIIGHVSPGKGIVVHIDNCHNVRDAATEPSKYFDVSWDNSPNEEFACALRLELHNVHGALARVTTAISKTGSNIQSLYSEEKDDYIYNVDLVLTVTDRVHLAQVIKKVRLIEDVQKVERHKK